MDELHKALGKYAGWMSQEDYQECVKMLNGIRITLKGRIR